MPRVEGEPNLQNIKPANFSILHYLNGDIRQLSVNASPSNDLTFCDRAAESQEPRGMVEGAF